MNLNIALVASKPDGVLRVVITGRVSTLTQDMKSIDSQHLDAETWLKSQYRGTSKIKLLGERASGWLANRATMVEAERMVKEGEVDLFLVTELREVYRNPAFHWKFVQLCVDHHVRFISIADNIDTCRRRT